MKSEFEEKPLLLMLFEFFGRSIAKGLSATEIPYSLESIGLPSAVVSTQAVEALLKVQYLIGKVAPMPQSQSLNPHAAVDQSS